MGCLARSARRNYTAPSPPTSPTWSTVHSLLATDSSILPLSSPLFTRYSLLFASPLPFLSFLPSLPPCLGPSPSASVPLLSLLVARLSAAAVQCSSSSCSPCYCAEYYVLLRFPPDKIPRFSYRITKIPKIRYFKSVSKSSFIKFHQET